jgi:hypothetical protein
MDVHERIFPSCCDFGAGIPMHIGLRQSKYCRTPRIASNFFAL